MNKQTSPKNQIEGSKIEKHDSELLGQIIRPGGRIIQPPRKKILTVAAAYNLIDRGERAIQHDSR
jgi:hypothetical protein